MANRSVVVLLTLSCALPLLAQATTAPVAQIVPEHPRDANTVTIIWSQKVAPAMKFDAPVAPYQAWWSNYPGYMTYGTPHNVTIRQTARPDATGEAEHHDSVPIYVEAGTYSVTLELTVLNEGGPATIRYPLAEFVVPSSCYPAVSAFTTYSPGTRTYQLHFDTLLASNEAYYARGTATVEGNHITVRQPMISGDAAPQFWRCVDTMIDVGALAPGFYRLTWIDSLTYALGPPGVFESIHEATIEVGVPRRRTVR